MKVVVIIPALNEAAVIGDVVRGIPREAVQEIIVVDNGSTDCTASVASAAGATVIKEVRRGYGAACTAGYTARPDADVFVFLDGDGSDPPELVPTVIAPLLADDADVVLGVRRGEVEACSMAWHQALGNTALCWLISRVAGRRVTDLPSFKAISSGALLGLELSEMTYGWTIEFVARSAFSGLRIAEIQTGYRKRVGVSKVSGTVKGSLLAAYRMSSTLLRVWKEHRTALVHAMHRRANVTPVRGKS